MHRNFQFYLFFGFSKPCQDSSKPYVVSFSLLFSKPELEKLGAQVFGLSTQNTEYQKEAVERLHLPFELLSDCDLSFAEALKLPTFEIADLQLIKRVTLIAKYGKIVKVFYPVFPPDRNADEVINWLQNHTP
ncbi:peroxiredoxin [Geitlerinema sp. CS-897]|nr:peroxiredoxin [Geitlerinema sp. CS-897]